MAIDMDMILSRPRAELTIQAWSFPARSRGMIPNSNGFPFVSEFLAVIFPGVEPLLYIVLVVFI